jgi:hypothetical protein
VTGDDTLILWTVYDHPRDFPRHVVARAHAVFPDGPRAAAIGCLYDTLAEARHDMWTNGLNMPLARHPEDDEVIVETWV